MKDQLSYPQTQMYSYSLNMNGSIELLPDADAKLLAQCERSYSQMQMQSYSLSVNGRLTGNSHFMIRSDCNLWSRFGVVRLII